MPGGHAGNAELRQLVESDPATYPGAFVYSVLQALPLTAARDQVLCRETAHKVKLGSMATGLNRN